MCLTKSNIHAKDYSKPFVAEKDIIVYKALDHCDIYGTKKIRTPYQNCPINFVDGKCVMVSKLEELNKYNVGKGLHSFRNEEEIKITCAFFPETKMTKHWAIIPKGSEYFIGKDEDVVSDNLIIFKSREYFRKYKREHECTKINLHN